MAFKDRLKQARIKAGFTQQSAAHFLGIAKSTYSGYETGKSEPSMYIITGIMHYFSTTADWLFQDEMVWHFENEHPKHYYSESLLSTESEDENELLRLYRKLTVSAKEVALTTIRAFVGNPSMQKEAQNEDNAILRRHADAALADVENTPKNSEAHA